MSAELLRQQAHTRLALMLIWLTPMLWTVNQVAARLAPGVVAPHVLAFGRWGIAGLILMWLARRELWLMRDHICRTWYQSLVLGGCGMWICGAWVYVAGQSTSAMNISLIYASSPVMIAVGSVLWLGEHFTKRQILGVALSVAGVMHVLVRGHWSALAQVELVVGDLWILAAAIAWAAYALLQKHWHSPLSATARLATICMGGIVVLLPFTIWELSLSATPELGQQAYFLIGLTALVPGLGAYWIYGWTQRILGTSRVAVTLYLGPLYAGLAAWLLLNEPLGWHHLAGGLLILSGVGLVMATQKKSELGHAE
ncbi:DMT family transporter [Limnohabitans sp. Rim8]|jgi:drug/metabolite transporter (DMT)-like permease|uniref:DMT family transporter n=1 Tax=Limnohabitans sp. Rim8 TaxID=1100718 RepID=UPI002603CAE6|nr:DMT family transporter [Limnohabitans sp. Rim8]